MKQNQRFFVWLLPILWAGCSIGQYLYPGDDYFMYAYGSIAGTWIAFVIDVGDPKNPAIPISIALVGAAVMASAGLLMDRAGASRRVWWIVFGVSACALFGALIMPPGALDRAGSKNVALLTYAFFSVNIGIYLSLLITLAGAGILRLRKRSRSMAGADTREVE